MSSRISAALSVRSVCHGWGSLAGPSCRRGCWAGCAASPRNVAMASRSGSSRSGSGQADLLRDTPIDDSLRPLADRMRPRTLDEYVGQEQVLGAGKPLRTALERGQLHSLILWGPPGTGKTTLARLI